MSKTTFRLIMRSESRSYLKVAVIGTNGLPAKYGGFETLTHNLVSNLQDELRFNVYCSSTNTTRVDVKNSSVRLSVIPLKANGWQSIPYDSISMLLAALRGERILMLGSSGGLLVPILRMFGKKIIVNVGGVDWQRGKWNWAAQTVIKLVEFCAVKFASRCVVDNEHIEMLYKSRYGVVAEYIPYGGDHVRTHLASSDRQSEYPWINDRFALSVSRAQRDNNIHVILEAWESLGDKAPLPLVVISNWESSEYGRSLLNKYSNKENIKLLPAIYDQGDLDAVRARASLYVHSHSACGTAPSLVEAMCHGLPVVAFDAPANRYTTSGSAFFFSTPTDICRLLDSFETLDLEGNARDMASIAKDRYTWKKCCESYRKIILD